MTKPEQQRRAERFRALHAGPPILVLPNVWDVVSARLYEVEGFSAVATTSAGVAATLGYPDGEQMSLAESAEVVRRITSRVAIPVSVDLEAGYAKAPDGVAQSARTILHAGAVGINLEDSEGEASESLIDLVLQCERIAAVRAVADSEAVPLVINARTDSYLLFDSSDGDRFGRTVERANAYKATGADCIFVPDLGDLDEPTIAALVKEIDAPLNVIAGAGTPSLGRLEELGVARVSFGPRAMRAALALVRRIAREWTTSGTYSEMLADALSYAEVNQMLTRPQGDSL
ncbi:MAG: isocitrate lyase/phosphoenolpyruvate mutase family protein [Phycisphaerae bacterium]|jgi:2-methylisocitrate lyase-like PEP mutase family enzyme